MDDEGRPDDCVSEELWRLCMGASSVFKTKSVLSDKIDVFDSKTIPCIDIGDYLTRVVKFVPLNKQQFLLAMEYLDRYLVACKTLLSPTSMHRLAAIAMVLAHKFDCDFPLRDARYGRIVGLSRRELMDLQMVFMRRVQYNLMYPEILREFPESSHPSTLAA
jgi:Cyclin